MKYLHIIVDSIILGYAFTSLVVAILMLNKREPIKRISGAFMETAIKIVRWVGLAAIIIWFLGTAYDLINGGVTERASGEYAWIYWMLVFGPLISQLLWIAKVRNSFIGLIFVGSGLIWTSGVFLEDFTIATTYIHREYTEAWSPLMERILKHAMRIATFIALVWLLQSVNARRKLINKKLKSNT